MGSLWYDIYIYIIIIYLFIPYGIIYNWIYIYTIYTIYIIS